MPVTSNRYDVRDDDLDTQIANDEPSGTINDRELVKEGQNHIRVVWFYDSA